MKVKMGKDPTLTTRILLCPPYFPTLNKAPFDTYPLFGPLPRINGRMIPTTAQNPVTTAMGTASAPMIASVNVEVQRTTA